MPWKSPRILWKKKFQKVLDKSTAICHTLRRRVNFLEDGIMLKPQEALLETTAQKIARILIRQYGINVRVEGSRACIDMETMTVVIPNLSGKEAEDLGEQGDGSW